MLLMVTTSYNGPAYERLRFYKNTCAIRRKIYSLTEKFQKTHIRIVSQIRDAARSAKQNIREGYSKDTVGEFAHSIIISKGSISELEGDLDDFREDNLVEDKEYVALKELISKTRYQMDRYIDSLYKLEREGRWKPRFKRNQ